jgi:hypothetical protein
MSLPVNLRLAGFFLLVSLTLIVSGCAGAQATPQAPANPTVVIVQYVTQIVATVTPAPPAAPTTPPTQHAPVSGGFDPYSVQPYYPIDGCQMASRLHVGDVAFVATGGESFNIHISRNVGFAPVVRKLSPGELLYITDEATCNRNGLVWGVLADADNAEGFVLEGNGETYWILPYGETYNPRDIRDRKNKTP